MAPEYPLKAADSLLPVIPNLQSVIPAPQPVIPAPQPVIPTKVGIQKIARTPWIPASAGMTNRGVWGDVYRGARMTNIGSRDDE